MKVIPSAVKDIIRAIQERVSGQKFSLRRNSLEHMRLLAVSGFHPHCSCASLANFPFIGQTRKPQPASAFAMRSITTEIEAINYDVKRFRLKQYYIAACMNVHESIVSKWCKNKPFPHCEKRLARFCEVTGSTALKQFRELMADKAADALIETPAQKAMRLINMEQAA